LDFLLTSTSKFDYTDLLLTLSETAFQDGPFAVPIFGLYSQNIFLELNMIKQYILIARNHLVEKTDPVKVFGLLNCYNHFLQQYPVLNVILFYPALNAVK
jgi:hypothetical protein